MNSLLEHAAGVESLAALSRFRGDFRRCLAARGDELFELADAVLRADGRPAVDPAATGGRWRRSLMSPRKHQASAPHWLWFPRIAAIREWGRSGGRSTSTQDTQWCRSG